MIYFYLPSISIILSDFSYVPSYANYLRKPNLIMVRFFYIFYDDFGYPYKYMYSEKFIMFDNFNRMSKAKEILKYSDPELVKLKARLLFGNDIDIRLSHRVDKKYMIKHPNKDKHIHFGQMGAQDFTKHKDLLRRDRYLKRATNIKGDWKKDPFSPNNLSIHLLW